MNDSQIRNTRWSQVAKAHVHWKAGERFLCHWISHVSANIDNNNNNNNNNDNNDNVNNNNQISDSADATNMGNARLLSSNTKNSFTSLFSSISPSVCLPLLLCEVLQQAKRQNLSSASKKTTEVCLECQVFHKDNFFQQESIILSYSGSY